MKAAVLHGPMDMRYEEKEKPTPKSGEARIKVSACGVCGSDYPRILDGTAHYFPIILGHEFAGIVDEVGLDVTELKTGDAVVAVPLVPCMECPACKEHHYSLCNNYRFIGTRCDGGYAEYAVLPASNLIKMKTDADTKLAALMEPATVALHGIRRSGMPNNAETTCVVGGGTIGSFCTEWLRIRNAEMITVIGRDRKRLDINRDLGATHTFSTLDDDAETRALTVTNGQGYAFVYETGGTPETLKMAIRLTARRGTLCLIGCLPGEITFGKSEWEQIARKELQVVGSWMSGGAPYPGEDWEDAVRCYEDGSLRITEDLLGVKLPLTRANELPTILQDSNRPKGRIILLCDE